MRQLSVMRHILHIGVDAFAWLIAAAWMYKLAEAMRGFSRVANLFGEKYDAAASAGASIAVIVPARNEAASVGACVQSLLEQDYRDLRVIAVDDRSDDDTGRILDRLRKERPERLSVIHIGELPQGWLGKTHAMVTAAQQAIAQERPEYLLFTDADVFFQRDVIRRALAFVAESRADHCVVMPTTIARSGGEAMVLAFLQVMSWWAVRPWRVEDPNATRDAIGVGAFNLVRTEAYQRLGGFEARPMEILEDLTFGREVKAAGLRQRVAVAPGMISVHWAASIVGILHGMTKNVFAVFRYRVGSLLAAIAGIAVICFGPVGMCFVAGARVPAALAWVSVAGLYALSGRVSLLPAWTAALLPVSAGLTIYAMLRSMVTTLRHGGVTWRGTFYPLAELRADNRRRA